MDIVERLREAANDYSGENTETIEWEAANEIERLQKINHRLAEIASEAVEWLPPASVNGPREKYQNEIKELIDGHC
jgi:hypothetical protein